MVLFAQACKKDKVAKDEDRTLLDLARATTGFTWYKNDASLLPRSAASGHSQAYLRTRYNATASSKLDSLGKVDSTAIFPEGSLIVKELFKDANTLDLYAILYKSSGHENADANGWVWGYINADETVNIPSSDKGSACISCHSQSGNIDYMLMNKYFP